MYDNNNINATVICLFTAVVMLGIVSIIVACQKTTLTAFERGYIQQVVVLPGQPAYTIWVKPKMESLMAPAMASNNKGDN